MRIGVRKRVSIRFGSGPVSQAAVAQFLPEQGSRWGARRDILDRAIFGVPRLPEVPDGRQSEIEIEASFDEFNPDVRVSYKGDVLEFPECRPSDEQILESEGGVRLLAGFML